MPPILVGHPGLRWVGALEFLHRRRVGGERGLQIAPVSQYVGQVAQCERTAALPVCGAQLHFGGGKVAPSVQQVAQVGESHTRARMTGAEGLEVGVPCLAQGRLRLVESTRAVQIHAEEHGGSRGAWIGRREAVGADVEGRLEARDRSVVTTDLHVDLAETGQDLSL